jgi:hypothetical protein
LKTFHQVYARVGGEAFHQVYPKMGGEAFHNLCKSGRRR